MYARIAHIYGSLAINSYGTVIAAAFLLFMWLVSRDKKSMEIMSAAQCLDCMMVGFLSAFAGGRIVFLMSTWPALTTWWDVVAFWEGGFSILGSIIGVLLVVPLYLFYKRIPIVSVLDLAAIYAPLLQGISRIGCFLAGCCYGASTTIPWAVTYYDSYTRAPYGVPLHPAQLYSSCLLIGLFLIMYYGVRRWFTRPGQAACFYLLGAATERFIIDFVRGDRIMMPATTWWRLLSFHQWIALALVLGSLTMLIVIHFQGRKVHAQ